MRETKKVILERTSWLSQRLRGNRRYALIRYGSTFRIILRFRCGNHPLLIRKMLVNHSQYWSPLDMSCRWFIVYGIPQGLAFLLCPHSRTPVANISWYLSSAALHTPPESIPAYWWKRAVYERSLVTVMLQLIAGTCRKAQNLGPIARLYFILLVLRPISIICSFPRLSNRSLSFVVTSWTPARTESGVGGTLTQKTKRHENG